MSRTLKLMEETDLQRVIVAVAEALAPREAACSLNLQHDDERLVLTVETDVPAAEAGGVYRDIVVPLLAVLEGEFGEFSFEFRSLCACGQAATLVMLGEPEHDMCLCGDCLGRSIDKHRDGPQHTCPVCETGFDGSGWSVRCHARLVSDKGAEPEMDIRTTQRDTDMSRWDCCSRRCALRQFRTWLSEVEAHPVAKEARP